MNKRTLKKFARPGETWVQTLARVHHEALLVEMLGYEHAGVQPAQFLAMVDAGILQQPEEPPRPNAFETVMRAGDAYGKAEPNKLHEMRVWDTISWKKYLKRQTVSRRPGDLEHDAIAQISLPSEISTHFDEARLGKRLPAPRRVELDARQRRAYKQALERAGMYCKRLGEVVAEDLGSATTAEVWRGDKLVSGGDPEVRRTRMLQIQKKTAAAIEQRWTPERLTEELQGAVADATRDWNRVAVTELQFAFNDAVFLGGVEKDGINARFAKIPETTACSSCLELYLETPDKPKVLSASAWLSNGNNVGKQRAQWRATLAPAHPRCRCSPVLVPAGHTITRSGQVLKETP